MAMTTLTIEIDEDELRRLNEACAARGMTVQEMIGNFIRRFRRLKILDDVFFNIKRKLDTWSALRAFDALCKEGQNSPCAGMSMEEIDAEIALARAERKARERC